MVLLTLKHMRPGVLTMEEIETETRAFSSLEIAEQWLLENNFYKGRRPFFKYPDNMQEWCHPDEMSWDFVDVIIDQFPVDETSASRFKTFHFEPAPWHKAALRDGFVEALQKEGLSEDEIKAIYEKHFGEKWPYARIDE